MRPLTPLALMALAQPSAAAAQTPPRNAARVVDEIAECRGIAEATQRLACFDRAAAQLAALRQRRDIVVFDREAVTRSERELFGFAGPRFRLFGSGGEPTLDEIKAKVVSAGPSGYHYAVSLDDGSRWVTTEAATFFTPRPGTELTIERGALGGYRAKYRNSSLVRIRRVQ